MQRRAHVAMPTVVTLVSWNHVCVFWGSVYIEASTRTRMRGGKGGKCITMLNFSDAGHCVQRAGVSGESQVWR
jgi:hypothetical protein